MKLTGDQHTDWVLLHGDPDKTYPFKVGCCSVVEATPAQIAAYVNREVVEITRGEYNSLLSRIDQLEELVTSLMYTGKE